MELTERMREKVRFARGQSTEGMSPEVLHQFQHDLSVMGESQWLYLPEWLELNEHNRSTRNPFIYLGMSYEDSKNFFEHCVLTPAENGVYVGDLGTLRDRSVSKRACNGHSVPTGLERMFLVPQGTLASELHSGSSWDLREFGSLWAHVLAHDIPLYVDGLWPDGKNQGRIYMVHGMNL